MAVDSNSADSTLRDLGWRPFFEEQRGELEPNLVVGRVSLARREHYHMLTASGSLSARLGGRLRHEAASALDLPAVGDWVAAKPPAQGRAAQVVHLFERRTRFVRKVAGRRTEVQVVAANVDQVAVVTTPNNDFNVRRLERYISAIRESGAAPLFILNKADLCDDPAPFLDGFRQVAADAPVLVTRALEGVGLEALRKLSGRGDTLVFVGSSGVGKSTIVNRLLGLEIQRVGDIRERDDRGRHVTSHRELFMLDDGGLLMDTPGMRELQVWAFGDEEIAGFADIDALAPACRFRDCSHHDEPGCAVHAAIEGGTLPADRLAGYHKLQLEVQAQIKRQEEAAEARANPKGRWRAISKMRKFYKNK
jgi:ribosome biogenesis GTPase / thiamine phosphate phosphatase